MARNPNKKNLDTEVVMVGPKLATEWLKLNTVNRPLSKSFVDLLADSMSRGKYALTGEPVIFSDTKRLTDGQHRLTAVAQSGATVPMLVVRGVDESAFHKTNIGRSRTASDILHAEGRSHAVAVASAARVINSIRESERAATKKRNKGTRVRWAHRQLNADIVEFSRRNITALTEAAGMVKSLNSKDGNMLSPPSIFVALTFLFNKAGGTVFGNEFIRRLSDGTDQGQGSPILAMRNILIKRARAERGKIPPPQVAALAVKAWNAWLNDRTVKSLRWTQNEQWPIMERVD